MSVSNIKTLSQVVYGKKVYRQTNIVTEKAKAIYPLYTSYAGGIMKFIWKMVQKNFIIVFPTILIQLENGPNEFHFYFTN